MYARKSFFYIPKAKFDVYFHVDKFCECDSSSSIKIKNASWPRAIWTLKFDIRVDVMKMMAEKECFMSAREREKDEDEGGKL